MTSVRLSIPGNRPSVEIMVNGEVSTMEAGEAAQLSVTFTDFAIKLGRGMPVRLPLPRPVGSLCTTYCDADLRISRGGRGGIFVLRRLRPLREDD